MEVKIYACDVCGRREASRLEFVVDENAGQGVPGYADLCSAHMAQLAQHLVREFAMNDQRVVWKSIRKGDK